ncbi:MAG TPA: type II secretion system minor pseudopilin GspI, partial [Coxiellaceae bacterium]|nr:type II secretion system minor pseudopilin GspI [Coxiellaceae bacterium]
MKNNKSLGFTLIEVLIALFIIAIALAAVIRATNNGIRTAIHVRDTMAAHWVGLNVISELQIGAFQLPMDGGPLRGKSVMENQVWQWVVHPQSSEK